MDPNSSRINQSNNKINDVDASNFASPNNVPDYKNPTKPMKENPYINEQMSPGNLTKSYLGGPINHNNLG